MADSPSELQLEIEKLERKHAENPEGRFFVPLANAYRKMGDVETAEALLRNGVERHPDYLSAHIVLGRCLADRGAVREAEDEFRFVLSQDPQNLIALRTLGELAVADSRPGEGADWYRELLAVDPMNEDARQALDSLSDAPASAELESEFRSGAGWWDPSAASEESPPQDEGVDAGMDGQSEGDVASLTDETPSPDTGAEPPVPEAEAAWAGYDDLPSMREDAPVEGAWGRSRPRPSPRSREDAPRDDSPPQDQPPLEAPVGDNQAAAPEPFTPGYAEAEPLDDDSYEASDPDAGSSEVVTETIAELYARQGLHERAAVVYRELIRRRGGDPALEQRLADIERMGREEQAQEQEPSQEQDREEEAFSGLALEDEEALISPALDGEPEDDPFAMSFAEGFTTLSGDEEEAAAAAPTDPDSFEAAPAELEPEPSQAADSGEPTIAHYLSGLVRWRPASAPPAAGLPERQDEETAAAGGDSWDEVSAETAAGLETAPQESAESAEAIDLPYLEEVVDAASDAGTVPAEDEPFPWELPGSAPIEETPAPPEQTPTALDPFFVDDVEPAIPQADPPLPEAAPPQLPTATPEEEPAAASDPSEDEDLESFQAWLRSLKR